MDMTDHDLELKLTRGSPIQVENVGTLYPLTLAEISDIGEIKYNKYIFSTNLKKELFGLEKEEITPFELTFIYCRQDESFKEMFLEALSYFFRENVYFHENGFFYLGALEEVRIIGVDNFDNILKIIKKQNFISYKDEEEFNPVSEEAKELVSKLKHFRQKVKEKNRENGLDLSDIISIVAAHSGNINIFNVWDLTVFQLYTLYIRLMMKENFDQNYYLLPHVSDSKSLNLEHWASKIKK